MARLNDVNLVQLCHCPEPDTRTRAPGGQGPEHMTDVSIGFRTVAALDNPRRHATHAYARLQQDARDDDSQINKLPHTSMIIIIVKQDQLANTRDGPSLARKP